MLSRVIETCARNRFLVITVVLLLTLAGVWSLRNISLDALPDISDVQVIVHTAWNGQPPDVIEDQVTYPIVTSLLSAPGVKTVRAQTMFGDSYVYVVFQDRTDIYWARSRVTEYLQQIGSVCRRMCIQRLGRMQLAPVGCSNMPSWTGVIGTALPICEAYRIGIYGTPWKRCLASRKWRASEGSSGNIR
jgi:hypothetical protein